MPVTPRPAGQGPRPPWRRPPPQVPPSVTFEGLISLSTLLPSTFDRDLVSVTEEGDEVRHAWYQWVVFVLFFQVPPSAIS